MPHQFSEEEVGDKAPDDTSMIHTVRAKPTGESDEQRLIRRLTQRVDALEYRLANIEERINSNGIY